MTETLYADIIAENILSHVYEEGNINIIVKNDISHHFGPGTVPIADIHDGNNNSVPVVCT